MLKIIKDMRRELRTYREVAESLEKETIATLTGAKFHAKNSMTPTKFNRFSRQIDKEITRRRKAARRTKDQTRYFAQA